MKEQRSAKRTPDVTDDRVTRTGVRRYRSPPRGGAPANYEASDCGLLCPDLTAGIRRAKGVRKIGVRLGNWLTPEQSQRLWNTPDSELLKGKRDRALLAVLLAGGLRPHEAVNLNFGHIQQREDHLAIVDLKGKAGHTRTVPVPG